MLAADSLNVFDDNVILRSAMKYLPDQTGQTDALQELTFSRIRKETGCDPIFLSCHLCFAQMFSEEDLLAFLALDYSELYSPIAKWEKQKVKQGYIEDSFPPNFSTLVKTAISDAKAIKGAKRPSPKVPGDL